MYFISYVILQRLRDQCNHPVKFGGFSHCRISDKTYLICHVTLQYRVIKGSCDDGRRLLIVCNHPARFGAF